MTILLAVIFGLIAYFGHRFIRKLYVPLLLIFTIVGLIPIFIVIPIFEEFVVSGLLGLSMYYIVMIAGAFKQKSTIGKRLRSVRKEYSIFGFMLLVPHFYIYLAAFLNGSLSWELYGVIAFVIMVPLFITSFTLIRKKMSTKNWFNLQKFAYVAYLLIFIHLLVIGSGEHTFEYVLVFSLYFVLKLLNYVFVKKSSVSFGIIALYFIGIFTFSGFWFFGNTGTELTDSLLDNQVNTVVTTTTTVTDAEGNVITTTTTSNDGPIALADGDYTGSAYGYKDLIVTVVVTVENGYIIDIEFLSYGSTDPERGVDFVQAAIATANQMLSSQTVEVDAIAGATHTTEGVMAAVYNALH